MPKWFGHGAENLRCRADFLARVNGALVSGPLFTVHSVPRSVLGIWELSSPSPRRS